MIALLYARPDGTFVIEYGGYPYHVTTDDPLFPEVAAAAVGVDLPPEPPPPTPSAPPAPTTITRRQFILALHAAGFISGPDALAWATAGAAPSAFEPILAEMPADAALEARITIAAMTVAERGSPLIAMLIAASLATDAQADALFVHGATL